MALIEGLGAALLELRRRNGWSQRQLAARCRAKAGRGGLTQAMISQWERGAQRPSTESLALVLEAMGASFHDLQLALDGGASASHERAEAAMSDLQVAGLPAAERLRRELSRLDRGGDASIARQRTLLAAQRSWQLMTLLLGEMDQLIEHLGELEGGRRQRGDEHQRVEDVEPADVALEQMPELVER